MKITTKVVAVIEEGNQILLIKEWSNKRNGYFWNLIKGTFDDDTKESLEDCAKREALEEAGVNIEVDHLISVYVSSIEDVRLQFNFLCHLSNKDKFPSITNTQDQKGRGEDIVEVKWFDKKEVLIWSKDQFINEQIYKVIIDWNENKRSEFEIMS